MTHSCDALEKIDDVEDAMPSVIGANRVEEGHAVASEAVSLDIERSPGQKTGTSTPVHAAQPRPLSCSPRMYPSGTGINSPGPAVAVSNDGVNSAEAARLESSRESFFRRFFGAVARVRQVMNVPPEELLQNKSPTSTDSSDPDEANSPATDTASPKQAAKESCTDTSKPSKSAAVRRPRQTAARAASRPARPAPIHSIKRTDEESKPAESPLNPGGSLNSGATGKDSAAASSSESGNGDRDLTASFEGRIPLAVLLEAEVAWARRQLMCSREPSSHPINLASRLGAPAGPREASGWVGESKSSQSEKGKTQGDNSGNTNDCASSKHEVSISRHTAPLLLNSSCSPVDSEAHQTGIPESENMSTVPSFPATVPDKSNPTEKKDLEWRAKELHRLEATAAALRCLIRGTSPPLAILQRLATLLPPSQLSQGKTVPFPRILELLASARAIRMRGPLKKRMIRRLRAIEEELLERRRTSG